MMSSTCPAVSLGRKHDWLQNMMGSEVGKWMLENNLMEYYSDQMNKDLREAATKI